jgi:hypothetical protein
VFGRNYTAVHVGSGCQTSVGGWPDCNSVTGLCNLWPLDLSSLRGKVVYYTPQPTESDVVFCSPAELVRLWAPYGVVALVGGFDLFGLHSRIRSSPTEWAGDFPIPLLYLPLSSDSIYTQRAYSVRRDPQIPWYSDKYSDGAMYYSIPGISVDGWLVNDTASVQITLDFPTQDPWMREVHQFGTATQVSLFFMFLWSVVMPCATTVQLARCEKLCFCSNSLTSNLQLSRWMAASGGTRWHN